MSDFTRGVAVMTLLVIGGAVVGLLLGMARSYHDRVQSDERLRVEFLCQASPGAAVSGAALDSLLAAPGGRFHARPRLGGWMLCVDERTGLMFDPNRETPHG